MMTNSETNSALVLGCTANWLDYVTDQVSAQNSCNVTYTLNQPWSWYYPIYVRDPARPVKLTLSEVERLRLAAKDDPKVKAILQKFTALIEITMDFE